MVPCRYVSYVPRFRRRHVQATYELPVNPRAGSSPTSSSWRSVTGLGELSRVRWCWNGSRSPRWRHGGPGLSRLSLPLHARLVPHRVGTVLDAEKRCCRWMYSCDKNSDDTQRSSPSAIIAYNSASRTEHAHWRRGWRSALTQRVGTVRARSWSLV